MAFLVSGIRVDLAGRKRFWFHGINTAHNVHETYFIDMLLTRLPFRNIIELGTGNGGLTLIFGLQALRTNAQFLTIDLQGEPRGFYEKFKPLLPITFRKLDVFGEEAYDLIKECLSRRGRAFLYCDDGNKNEEFNKYAPLLKVGDVIGAHDRYREMSYKKIEDTVEQCNLKPFYESVIQTLKCRQYMFMREKKKIL